MTKKCTVFLAVGVISLTTALTALGAGFVHPGMDQGAEDLQSLKLKVQRGEQPFKDAFETLKAGTSLGFSVNPVTHISQGGYGANDQGGKHLSAGSRLAYDCALLWYLTDDKAYAQQAIHIIEAWSSALWDFDDNNAKLVAAGSISQLCKAAEILRYTDAGWQTQDIEDFKRLIMTVYYPLLRFYFPEANGNWDGYIIRAMMTMGIFMDSQAMFDNAVNHFLYAPVNGSLFKYIHPSGQCQESTRDHGHVQMGLGAFANVAQIAWTQGVDLFSIGNNRLATGIEYEARFLLGHPVFCYGLMSQVKKKLSDSKLNYVYVRQQYAHMGIDLPYTRQVLDTSIEPSARHTLTALRSPAFKLKEPLSALTENTTAFPAGALDRPTRPAPADAIQVEPGQPLQQALDLAAKTGGWVVAKKGLHILPKTLRLPSGVTLSGEGVDTVLWLDPDAKARDALRAVAPDLHDVTVCDLMIDGASQAFEHFGNQSHRSFRNRQNRGGILVHADRAGQARHLTFRNITVKNCTNNGLFVTGARHVQVIACDLDENGSHVVPGPKLQHNLQLTHCTDVAIRGCRLDGSAYSSGLVLNACTNVTVKNCEVARNAHYGVIVSECSSVSITDCLIEGNDRTGVMIEYLHAGSKDVLLRHNLIQYNNGYGVEAYGATRLRSEANTLKGNRQQAQKKLSPDKILVTNETR